jgi:hypothetical protein
MQHSQERVCRASRPKETARPAAAAGAPATSGASAGSAATTSPAAREPYASEIGLPDLGSFQLALFNGIRSSQLAYDGVTRRRQWASQLTNYGTREMDALIKAEAQGSETASRYARSGEGPYRHSLRVTVVRMKRAGAAAEYVELQRKLYSGGANASPLQLAPPVGVQAFAFDSEAVRARARARSLVASRGPYLVLVREGRELPRGDLAAKFEPANGFAADFVLRQIASAFSAQ